MKRILVCAPIFVRHDPGLNQSGVLKRDIQQANAFADELTMMSFAKVLEEKYYQTLKEEIRQEFLVEMSKTQSQYSVRFNSPSMTSLYTLKNPQPHRNIGTKGYQTYQDKLSRQTKKSPAQKPAPVESESVSSPSPQIQSLNLNASQKKALDELAALGLSINQSQTLRELKTGYHRLLFQFHPDTAKVPQLEKFHDLQNSWRALKPLYSKANCDN